MAPLLLPAVLLPCPVLLRPLRALSLLWLLWLLLLPRLCPLRSTAAPGPRRRCVLLLWRWLPLRRLVLSNR